MLDSQTQLKAQRAWLESDLAASHAPWKIVAFHRTVYTFKSGRNTADLRAALVPILDKYHVDVVLNGHDHGIAWTVPMKGGEAVSSPSQGTIYLTAGRSGTKTYSDLSSCPSTPSSTTPWNSPTTSWSP